MRNLKRVLSSLPIALVSVLCFVTVVLAAPSGNVSNLVAIPSDTSMDLSWTPATGATSTRISYRIDHYPTTYADGTPAYDGTDYYCTVFGLTPGAVYYFGAWGYDGAGYSAVPAHCVMATHPIALPSGGEETPVPVIPFPTIPSTANATANITAGVGGWNLEPFTSIILYFVTGNITGGTGIDPSGGGLGMPVENAWEVLAIGLIVMGGIGTYTKQKNFFIAYFVVFILSCFFIGLHLVQWYLAPIEIVVGLGVWALERYFQ